MITDYIPVGERNAISRARLSQLIGENDRTTRAMIAEARKEHCILSLQDGNGYFQPAPDEMHLVERWIRQETSRAYEIIRMTSGAKRYRQTAEDGQMTMEEVEDGRTQNVCQDNN